MTGVEQLDGEFCLKLVLLQVLSRVSHKRSRYYKSPYQFCPVLILWYCAVAVFLVCHHMHNINAP